MKVTKAVIPAAGYGTRFLPITKGIPKEMLNLGGKPTIHYVVEEAVESGCDEVLIIINKGKECIKDYFNPEIKFTSAVAKENLKPLDELLEKVNISFEYQTVLNGNGGVLLHARDFVGDDPFVVIFGDDITVNPGNPVAGQLIKAYEKTGKTILGVQHRPKEEAVRYGVIEGKTEGRYTKVSRLVEKPPMEKIKSTLCSLGRFLLTSDIFEALENTKMQDGEIYLTNAIAKLIDTKGVYAYEFEGKRYDMGDKFGFLQASVEFGMEQYGDRFMKYAYKLFHGAPSHKKP